MQKTDILKSLVNIISFLFLNGIVMIKASLHVETFSGPDYIYTSETQSPKPEGQAATYKNENIEIKVEEHNFIPSSGIPVSQHYSATAFCICGPHTCVGEDRLVCNLVYQSTWTNKSNA